MFSAANPGIKTTESILVVVQSSKLIARIKGMRTILKNFIAIYFDTRLETRLSSTARLASEFFLAGLGEGVGRPGAEDNCYCRFLFT